MNFLQKGQKTQIGPEVEQYIVFFVTLQLRKLIKENFLLQKDPTTLYSSKFYTKHKIVS